MSAAPRADRYKSTTVSTHLALVDSDLDEHDRELDALADAVTALGNTMRERLTKILWAVVSLAMSLAVAAVSFALAAAGR